MRLLGGHKKFHWWREFKTIAMPRKGFIRLANYFWHRIGRLSATPYSIATGLACGIAISWTPFIGLHILLAIAMSWVIRGNILASVIGTMVAGNPWTFPFIWFVTYYSGVYFLEYNSATALQGLINFEGDIWQLIGFLFANFENLIKPMLIGSLPFVIFTWIGTFGIFYLAVSKYRTARNLRRRRKAEMRAAMIANIAKTYKKEENS